MMNYKDFLFQCSELKRFTGIWFQYLIQGHLLYENFHKGFILIIVGDLNFVKVIRGFYVSIEKAFSFVHLKIYSVV